MQPGGRRFDPCTLHSPTIFPAKHSGWRDPAKLSPSGFSLQEIRQGLTLGGLRWLHRWRVQIRRRLSGIFIALALARVPTAPAMPNCSLESPQMDEATLRAAAMPGAMDRHTSARGVISTVAPEDPNGSCDPTASTMCAGMTSCTGLIVVAQSRKFAGDLRTEKPRETAGTLNPGRGSAPEPPPPRA